MDNRVEIVEIERIGAQGDGVGHVEGQPVFVPFTLAGERVSVAVDGERAQLVEVLLPSEERISPACRHFKRCGGCALQHMSPAAYAKWKRGLVEDAFAQRGISIAAAPLMQAGPQSRRRAVLSAVYTRAGVVLGFHAARGATVIDVEECPVLVPRISGALAEMRTLLAALPRWEDEARVTIVAADNGLDVGIENAVAKGGLDASMSARLAADAARIGDLVRVSVDGVPAYQRGAPVIRMGAADVSAPAGVFLQASAAAEQAMADVVVNALPRRAKRAVDLFCGVGAFTFPLAARVAVTAVDSDKRAVAALEQASRGAQGLKPVTTLYRDLFREPLSRKELDPFDLAVLDPPRAGAKAQAEMLARSKVPVVVAVSCNPATLARDVRILLDGGYKLGAVTPVDQFHWSAHVEAVAVMTR
ncbi:MAG: class I SAM-dependent RNA methyltransferase [Hyphomicrobiaceae bacterium]|nr:class I SAM-dependent RNA methyltransferase [Hyphomicrobiaceae bacterium]